MNRLTDRVAVITGAGRGIGRGMALLFAKEGAKVVVNDPGVGADGAGHDNGPADQVVAEIKKAGGIAVANYDTVATMDGGEGIITTAVDNFGRIDILVNNAGILRDRMVFNMSEEEWDAVIAVHLKGHFACTKPASILMRQQRFGRIVNFSSTSGLIGNAGQANYGAAKAGIAGFTRVVARDLGRYGVTCNAIAPGASTRLTATVPQEARDRRGAAGISTGADAGLARMPTLMEPEYVAPMVAYLCSDDAWNITGQVFHVSGGTVSLSQQPDAFRSIHKPGMWTVDELIEMAPQLMAGVPNPAPPPPDLDVPGRKQAAAAKA